MDGWTVGDGVQLRQSLLRGVSLRLFVEEQVALDDLVDQCRARRNPLGACVWQDLFDLRAVAEPDGRAGGVDDQLRGRGCGRSGARRRAAGA